MSENIIVIGIHKKRDNEQRFLYSMDELISLSESAKGHVMEQFVQKRDNPHPATYLGSGKLEEIKEFVEDREVDLIIANDELSATQMRNLNASIDIPVIDRSQLILDIFASRAKTNEGKLQVELAQYQYLLPRLHGQGQSLSRLGGGIGTRGPGETKLETDRRHINRRIDEIKRKLEIVVNQRHQYRKRRQLNHTFQIAIVGYTNAGKSTLFNHLTAGETYVEDQLFATLDPTTRQLRLPSGLQTIITDTVGFMQDLPTALIAAFRSTLEEVKEADLIYHVVDSSHPDQHQHQHTVDRLLSELGADHIPTLTVYNKIDLASEQFLPILKPSISISAFSQEDRKQLLIKTEDLIISNWTHFITNVQADQGKLLQQYKQHAIIVKETFMDDESYKLEGYLPHDHPLLHRLN
ncbi:GTP-binding protein HflX [Pelagirhabdus alkalitolerans]|uniref:GTPase HflX n=1 Tax=Pelagirhabdus alkalitolerans TaxID=1612202 RepID=A0A1G6H5H0_9BACI|nr:GTPase HflX [Pelagirhabdus alkalitolerans]SDB89374.1 GTP-binding protein HflX [Pelagirhabdus alkalitolerans]